MKYALLLWAGLARKRSRTLLVFLSTTVAFTLLGLLVGVDQGVESISDKTDRAWVLSRGGSRDSLPMAHLGKIEKVAGVRRAVAVTAFRGYYQERRNAVAGSATDVPAFFDVFPELSIDPQQLEAMKTTRNGLLVGSAVAAKFGWKPGDRVPLGSSWIRRDGTNHWEFEVVGVFGVRPELRGNQMATALTYRLLVNHQYFDGERAFRNGTVSQFFVSTDPAVSAASIGTAIDKTFENSPDETLTQTEAASMSGPIKQLADLSIIVNGVCGAALFSLLLLVGNTMLQSVHERTGEFGVLKSLGFKDRTVVGLVIGEALTIFGFAAPLGLLIAWYFMPSLTAGFGTSIQMPPVVFAFGIAIAVALAVICALPPALRVNRLNIVDALANR
jgi:putative ABC transport system permease protein